MYMHNTVIVLAGRLIHYLLLLSSCARYLVKPLSVTFCPSSSRNSSNAGLPSSRETQDSSSSQHTLLNLTPLKMQTPSYILSEQKRIHCWKKTTEATPQNEGELHDMKAAEEGIKPLQSHSEQEVITEATSQLCHNI